MLEILPERPEDAAEIEQLLDLSFGAERQETKTVYRLRQGAAPIRELCLTAREDGLLRGCLRFWPVELRRSVPALLLGPIAVHPAHRRRGIGRRLMEHGLDGAKALGHRAVILVGEEAYYGRFGFRRAPAGTLALLGPRDAGRLLASELVPGALGGGILRRGRLRGGLSMLWGRRLGCRRVAWAVAPFTRPRAARLASGRLGSAPEPATQAAAVPAPLRSPGIRRPRAGRSSRARSSCGRGECAGARASRPRPANSRLLR